MMRKTIIVAAFALLLFAFGCILPPAPGPSDTFGQDVEAMNQQIYAASSASAVARLGGEVAALRSEALADASRSQYLPLIDAQNLTLQVLAACMEFRSEGAKLGASGIDCAIDYSAFISRLRAANATAAAAASKAAAWQSSHANSTARLLVSAINNTSPQTMAAYADLLEMQVARDCLPVRAPGAQYALPLSYADALSIASGVAADGYFVYGFQSPLPAGTVVSSPEGAQFALKKGTWFFFLDSNPWAPFGHDVKYVMIDVASAGYQVANGTMYPLIDGMPYWASSDQRENPDNVLYPKGVMEGLNFSSPPPVVRTLPYYALAGPDLNALNAGKASDFVCCQEKKKYALIMIGSNDTMFESDGKWMYEYLRGSGYDPANIYYVDALGTMPNADAQTTVASFEAGLDWLSRAAKCCDDVFLFLAAHGYQSWKQEYKNKATGEVKLVSGVGELANPADWEFQRRSLHHGIEVNPSVAGGGRVNSATFIGASLRDLQSCKTTVMYFSCFSGAAAPDLNLSGVTLITPVDGDHPAYGQNGDWSGWKAGSFFTESFIDAKGPANGTADANHDGTVTDREARDYANRKTQDEINYRWVTYDNLADGEANATKKARYEKLRDSIVEQKDGIYQEGPPCTCCYVNCSQATDWKCLIFEGRNTASSRDCTGKKIGDICRAATVTPPQDNVTGGGNDTPPQPPPNETGNRTGGNQTPPTDALPPVCGDGKITGNEGCDYGNASANKCPQGEYCHESCACKKLETSVVCGDGKISSPQEECDGGNVKFKLCPEGYTCSICKCVPSSSSAQCGDGRVTPPEECDHGNTFTSKCAEGKTCRNCRCVDYSQVQTHRACINEACVSVDGAGEDSCTVDEDCRAARCGDGTVNGNEQCERDADCGTGRMCSSCMCVDRPASCGDGKITGNEQCDPQASPNGCSGTDVCSGCMCYQRAAVCGDGAVNGNEQCDPQASPTGCSEGKACGSNCQCVSPPTLNCGQICGYTQGAQSVASGLASEQACKSAVSSYFQSRMCYTTCKYSWFYQVTNIAGSASCCCGMMKEFPCSDCPGQNPQCPDADAICQQNAPSWYSPPQ